MKEGDRCEYASRSGEDREMEAERERAEVFSLVLYVESKPPRLLLS